MKRTKNICATNQLLLVHRWVDCLLFCKLPQRQSTELHLVFRILGIPIAPSKLWDWKFDQSTNFVHFFDIDMFNIFDRLIIGRRNLNCFIIPAIFANRPIRKGVLETLIWWNNFLPSFPSNLLKFERFRFGHRIHEGRFLFLQGLNLLLESIAAGQFQAAYKGVIIISIRLLTVRAVALAVLAPFPTVLLRQKHVVFYKS